MDQQTSVDPQKRIIEWLNRFIMLAQWHRKLPFHAVTLIKERTEYEQFLKRVRASFADKQQLTDNAAETTPVVVARKKLLEAVAAMPALQQLFGADKDPFNDASPDELELLAEVSDVTADSQNMVLSRSGPLTSVLAAMRPGLELDHDQLMVDGLKRFLTLWETEKPVGDEKPVAELLYDLAISPHWYIVMASLRAGRDYARDEEPVVADLVKLWNEKIAKQTIKDVLLKPGYLSRAPKKLIQLAWEHRELFAEAREKIADDARAKDPEDERRQAAGSVFLIFAERFKTDIDGIRADLKLLATVAKHFIDVRKFAKFDGFVYNWPEIYQLARMNFAALKYVDERLRSRAPGLDADIDGQGARELYSLIEKNDRFKAFLRLRPYFSEINENELLLYRRLVPPGDTSGRPGAEMHESLDAQPQQRPAAPAPPPSTMKVREVQTIKLEQVQHVEPSLQQELRYNVEFMRSGNPVAGTVSFRVEKLLAKILAGMGVNSDSALQEILKALFADDPSFAEERIRRGSIELATNVLPVSTTPLSEVLATPPSLRVVVNSTDREIHYLPWEWWPTSHTTLLLSGPDHSLVRRVSPSPAGGLPPPMFRPLRLMSVILDPPKGIRFTSDITIKALKELASAPNVQYLPVVRAEATWDNLQRLLEDFKPHIVHLEGFWIINYKPKALAADPSVYDYTRVNFNDKPTVIGEFSTFLRKSGVQLLVIGRNGASTIYENSTATAAFELAKEGLSVIAPMRAIDDASATTFTTEFYRAFLAGNKLEPALHLARRNLASKGGDWSVFALFTDPDHVDHLELIRETA